ncbi:MAG: YybH family protein [Acidimicrobiales bacterium]
MSDLTEDEVRQQMEREFAAWNSGAVETIAANRYGFAAGYGLRTQIPRGDDARYSDAALLARVRQFHESMEYYDVAAESIEVAVHGDTGVSWGVYTEDFQVRGRPPEKLRVRFTQTFQKRRDGNLITLLAHRDIQPFDDDGIYIPSRPV